MALGLTNDAQPILGRSQLDERLGDNALVKVFHRVEGTTTVLALLVPQSDHRIDPDGPHCRNETRQE